MLTGAAIRLVVLRACAYCLVRIAIATGADTPLTSTTVLAIRARPMVNTAHPSPVVRLTASCWELRSLVAMSAIVRHAPTASSLAARTAGESASSARSCA